MPILAIITQLLKCQTLQLHSQFNFVDSRTLFINAYFFVVLHSQNLSYQMGNVDMTANQHLMASHNKFVLQFIRGEILFNVEDIKFPLSTSGMRIVDASGRRVKLAGGNWSGGHLCRECLDGLEMRPMRDIALDIRYKLKMNCIRLPYSLQLFFYNKVVEPKYLKANPELIGKTSLEIFDITIKTLTEVGLMVILNNHTSTSMWCCSNDDGDGLWWSRQFPEYKFFDSCEQLAQRYKDNPLVIGMDLRNQLRKAHGLAATWGDGNPVTDWKRAAKISGQKVLAVAPHWLILVGGLNYQLDLTDVLESPLQYTVKNKLVYTGHFYGFSWPVPSWALISYDGFKKRMFNTQTYVRALGFPYLLGQFGNNQQDIPWKYLIRYLKETDIDWTYWALDGFKCDPEQDETYGVFTNDFQDIRHPEMLADMISVGPPSGTVICQQPLKNANQTAQEVKHPQLTKLKQGTIKKLNPKHQDKEKHQIHQISHKQKPKIFPQPNQNKTEVKQETVEVKNEVKVELEPTKIQSEQKEVIESKVFNEQVKIKIEQQTQTLTTVTIAQVLVEKEKQKFKIFDDKYKN